MRRKLIFALAPLVLACSARPKVAATPEPPGATSTSNTPSGRPDLGDRVGSANFPTSCSPSEKGEMDRAVALLHSFFYDEARRRFQAIAERDSKCAMAQWGVAMTYWHPIWAAPRPDELEAGLAAVKKARSIEPVSPRERAYIEAIEAFYVAPTGSAEPASQSCHGVVVSDHMKGALAYEGKMQSVVAQFPGDIEAKAFYALALLATHPPTDATLAKPAKAARILEELFPANPDHPGIAHYLIHSYDYPPVAEKGLPAARSYARMAPWVPHALHMPSHIFTRLGMWEDSAASNLAAAEAARKYEARFHPGAHAAEELHALDYMVYAYLQSGQDAKAKSIVDYVATIDKTNPPVDLVAGSPFATIPARYALERRKWAEAAALKPTKLATNLPFIEAHVAYANAIGSARSNDPAGVKAGILRLKELRDAIHDPKYQYFVKQVDVQRAAAEAWLLRVTGDKKAAIAAMRSAADTEDALGKHPSTPGAVLPIREQLADLLYEEGDAAESLAEYERALRTTPNRLLALSGAAHAADRAHDATRAQSYFEKIAAIRGTGDGRNEIAEARARVKKQ